MPTGKSIMIHMWEKAKQYLHKMGGISRVFASAIGLFTLGSILCGLATSIEMLVACRVIQGAGGAMMMPVGRMTLARTFDKSDLVKAMSFVAIPSLIGPMIGPVAGGLIVAYLHWSIVFFVDIQWACSVSTSCGAICRTIARNRPTGLDFLGLVLFGGGIAFSPMFWRSSARTRSA